MNYTPTKAKNMRRYRRRLRAKMIACVNCGKMQNDHRFPLCKECCGW